RLAATPMLDAANPLPQCGNSARPSHPPAWINCSHFVRVPAALPRSRALNAPTRPKRTHAGETHSRARGSGPSPSGRGEVRPPPPAPREGAGFPFPPPPAPQEGAGGGLFLLL